MIAEVRRIKIPELFNKRQSLNCFALQATRSPKYGNKAKGYQFGD